MHKLKLNFRLFTLLIELISDKCSPIVLSWSRYYLYFKQLHLSFLINEDLYVIETGKDIVFVKFAVLYNDF